MRPRSCLMSRPETRCIELSEHSALWGHTRHSSADDTLTDSHNDRVTYVWMDGQMDGPPERWTDERTDRIKMDIDRWIDKRMGKPTD